MDRTIGILGGMGPQATVDLFQKIVNVTPAGCDQEHIKIIIDNDPKIPDRTKYIIGQGENPVNALIEKAIKLKLMGAELLTMPCNTAHYFYDEIIKYVDIPFINMITEVANEIRIKYGKGAKAGLLATLGTYKAKIYEEIFSKYGIEILVPNDDGKRHIYELIYQVKEGFNIDNLNNVSKITRDLKTKGAMTVILGCTELPLVKIDLPEDIEYIDTTLVLAKKAVNLAMYNT